MSDATIIATEVLQPIDNILELQPPSETKVVPLPKMGQPTRKVGCK